MYRHNKTTWLNILHAGWPAGMVAGGIAGIALGGDGDGGSDRRWRIAMLLVPMVLCGVLMLGHRFPVHERIEAGVSDKDMFRETGAIGLFLVLVFLFGEFGRLPALPCYVGVIAALICSGAFGIYTRSLGKPMFLFPFLGTIQDRAIETRLHKENPALYSQAVATKTGVMGDYQAIDPERVKSMSHAEQEALQELSATATTAIFSAIMLLGCPGLFIAVLARGGYRAVSINLERKMANHGTHRTHGK